MYKTKLSKLFEAYESVAAGKKITPSQELTAQYECAIQGIRDALASISLNRALFMESYKKAIEIALGK